MTNVNQDALLANFDASNAFVFASPVVRWTPAAPRNELELIPNVTMSDDSRPNIKRLRSDSNRRNPII